MSDNIEMDEMSSTNAMKSISAEPPLEPEAGRIRPTNDKSISVWAWSSAMVFALFSICLLAFPRFLLFLAEPSGGRGTLTALEKFLTLQLGIVLGALAITIIAALPNEWPTGLQPRTDPICHPLLRPVTVASLVMGLLAYENTSVGALATAVLLGSGVVGLFGLWMLVFSGPRTISRKTGADKHTSSFIFGNKNASSVKKRMWKKDQPR